MQGIHSVSPGDTISINLHGVTGTYLAKSLTYRMSATDGSTTELTLTHPGIYTKRPEEPKEDTWWKEWRRYEHGSWERRSH